MSFACARQHKGHTSLSSSVVAIERPISSKIICVYKKDPRAGMIGTAVAAVHGQSSMNMPNERYPTNTKPTADVTASKDARPIRIICNK